MMHGAYNVKLMKENIIVVFVSDAVFCFLIWIPSYISNLILTYIPNSIYTNMQYYYYLYCRQNYTLLVSSWDGAVSIFIEMDWKNH